MCVEPAKELTRTKEPEFMFLHTMDFWFRLIWIDLHQALTIDRESSRDRAPIGLVRCICEDDHIKGKHAYVKFKLSNIHAFVPIWICTVRNIQRQVLLSQYALTQTPWQATLGRNILKHGKTTQHKTNTALAQPPGRFVVNTGGRASNDPPPGLWICCRCPVGQTGNLRRCPVG